MKVSKIVLLAIASVASASPAARGGSKAVHSDETASLHSRDSACLRICAKEPTLECGEGQRLEKLGVSVHNYRNNTSVD